MGVEQLVRLLGCLGYQSHGQLWALPILLSLPTPLLDLQIQKGGHDLQQGSERDPGLRRELDSKGGEGKRGADTAQPTHGLGSHSGSDTVPVISQLIR